MYPENLKTKASAERVFCHSNIRPDGEPHLCCASNCMAWMWAGWRTKSGRVVARNVENERVSERLGYCGLVQERKK
jgi:sugar lactone lactonase YvrE